MKDLFGQAILDYQTKNSPENMTTATNISDADEMDVSYLFRDFHEMPLIEQTALNLAKGRVLDVGCGAGSHVLYLQNHKKLETVAVDLSPKAIEACKLRGLKNSFCANIFDITTNDFGQFDTILLLMNGTGICGELKKIDLFLQKLKSLLLVGGQILVDSSDILYMFDPDEIDEIVQNSESQYYGELIFDLVYKNQQEEPFYWLYLDFETLKKACAKNGLICEKIEAGENQDYLARLMIF